MWACMLHIFAPVCLNACVCTTDTQSWVKSSLDKLIISSLEERWLTEREAVNQQLLAVQKPKNHSQPRRDQGASFRIKQLGFHPQLDLQIFFCFFSLFMRMKPIYKNNCDWKKSSCIYRSKWLGDFNAYEQVSPPWNHWHKIKAFMFCIAVPCTDWIDCSGAYSTAGYTDTHAQFALSYRELKDRNHYLKRII